MIEKRFHQGQEEKFSSQDSSLDGNDQLFSNEHWQTYVYLPLPSFSPRIQLAAITDRPAFRR